MNIHENIRTERLRKGLSQDYVAFKLNLSQNGYQKIEAGKVQLKVNVLFAIAEVLEVSVTELLSERKATYQIIS